MGDIEADGEGEGPEARDRLKVRCSVRCIGSVGLWLGFMSGSDVRAGARLRIRVMVTCGWCRW